MSMYFALALKPNRHRVFSITTNAPLRTGSWGSTFSFEHDKACFIIGHWFSGLSIGSYLDIPGRVWVRYGSPVSQYGGNIQQRVSSFQLVSLSRGLPVCYSDGRLTLNMSPCAEAGQIADHARESTGCFVHCRAKPRRFQLLGSAKEALYTEAIRRRTTLRSSEVSLAPGEPAELL